MNQYKKKDGSPATIDQLKEFGITVYLAEYDCNPRAIDPNPNTKISGVYYTETRMAGFTI